MTSDAEYIRTVFPVLLTHIRRAVREVDLQKLREEAARRQDDGQLAFIDALLATRQAVARLDRPATPAALGLPPELRGAK